MGNCLEGTKNNQQLGSRNHVEYLEQSADEENQLQVHLERSEKNGSSSSAGGRKRKVKILLTKEESEWLMFQLKKTQGKKVEELLGEIVRNREGNSVVSNGGWKPCLDSITESSSQILEGMDR